MKKDLAIIFGLFLLIVVLLVFGQGFSSVGFAGRRPSNNASNSALRGTKTVLIKDLQVDATIASTTAARKKGLSKQESLPINGGMLFVFDKSSNYGIWMKDMKFPIDIIWISENKTIVDIASNVVGEPDKKDTELIIYQPNGSARYILEVNAGIANLHRLQIGDPVSFELK